MEREKAWKRFSQSGTVADYLEFRNCISDSTAGVKINENDYRRSGAKGNGYRGK